MCICCLIKGLFINVQLGVFLMYRFRINEHHEIKDLFVADLLCISYIWQEVPEFLLSHGTLIIELISILS